MSPDEVQRCWVNLLFVLANIWKAASLPFLQHSLEMSYNCEYVIFRSIFLKDLRAIVLKCSLWDVKSLLLPVSAPPPSRHSDSRRDWSGRMPFSPQSFFLTAFHDGEDSEYISEWSVFSSPARAIGLPSQTFNMMRHWWGSWRETLWDPFLQESLTFMLVQTQPSTICQKYILMLLPLYDSISLCFWKAGFVCDSGFPGGSEV